MKLYKKHISDLGKVITGKTPRTSILENYGGKIPFLTPSDNLSKKFSPTTSKTLTKIGLNEVKNCLLPSKSICVSCIGSDLGKVVLTKKPTVTNQQFNSIVPNEENDADFIYYLMTVVGKHLNYLSKTSTAVPIINKSTFANYEIEIPNIKEQKRIGKILSSLDDKIELNRRINDNLEQQAQALFKSWFVDFDPFKDGKFVESELGRIPKGWRVERLGSVCKCLLGGTPSRNKEEYWNGKIAWINSGEINEFRITKPSEYITQEGLKKSATKLLPKKTTVLAITGATLGQVSLLEIDSCANQSVIGLLENEDIFHEYIYPLIKNRIDDLCSHMTGGAQQHINKNNVEQLEILVPPKKILVEYKQIATPIYSLISNICFESQKISKLRDSLLPRLMSGELKLDKINN